MNFNRVRVAAAIGEGRSVERENLIQPHIHQRGLHRPRSRSRDAPRLPGIRRIHQRVILVVARVVPTRHIHGVRSVTQAGEGDGVGTGQRQFVAPRAAVEPPAEVRVAPVVGRSAAGAPVERATGCDRERGAGRSVGADRLAEDQQAARIQSATSRRIEAADTGAQRGRTRTGHQSRLHRLPARRERIADEREIEQWIGDDVVRAGTSPRHRQQVVLEDDGVIGRVVIRDQHRGVPDDVARDVGARAEGRGGQGQGVVVEVERGDVLGAAGAVLLVHMHERVVHEDEAPTLLVEDGVIHVVEEIVDDRPFAELAGHVGAAGDGAGGIERVVRAVGVAVGVQEDVAFNPGVRAVEVEMIIARAVEDVVDDLENGTGPLAAGEVNGVIEAVGAAEVIVAENAVAAGRNAVHAVQHLRRARREGISREDRVLDDEGAFIERDVLHGGRVRPDAVIDEHARIVHVHHGGVPADVAAAATLEIRVSNAALQRAVENVEAAPVAAAGQIAEADALQLGALGEQASTAAHHQARAGCEVERGTRLHRQRDPGGHGESGCDDVRAAGQREGGVAVHRAVNDGGGAVVVGDIEVGAAHLAPRAIPRLDQQTIHSGIERGTALPQTAPRRVARRHTVHRDRARLNGRRETAELNRAVRRGQRRRFRQR